MRRRALIVGAVVLGALASTPLAPRFLLTRVCLPGAGPALLPLVPEALEWEVVFRQGEVCGSALTLEQAVEAGQRWPGMTMPTWFDGFSHTWAPDLSDLPKLAERVERLAPEGQSVFLHDGVVRHITEEHDGAPKGSLPRVEAYAELAGTPPYNGVRVGLQRAQGHDLPHAIQTALLYPESYHGPLLEELGWRLGDEAQSPDDWALAEQVPAGPQRCAFVQGAERGWAMKQGWEDCTPWSEQVHRIDADPDCSDARLDGVGEALRISFADHPQAMERALECIQPPHRDRVAVSARDAADAPYETLKPFSSLKGPEPAPPAPSRAPQPPAGPPPAP